VPLLQSGRIADLLAALHASADSRTGGAQIEDDPRSGR